MGRRSERLLPYRYLQFRIMPSATANPSLSGAEAMGEAYSRGGVSSAGNLAVDALDPEVPR